jgi:hypothetical protein
MNAVAVQATLWTVSSQMGSIRPLKSFRYNSILIPSWFALLPPRLFAPTKFPILANLQLTLWLRIGCTIRGTSANFSVAFPPYGLEPLSKNWMRVVVRGVHPIRVHGAEILDLEFDQA